MLPYQPMYGGDVPRPLPDRGFNAFLIVMLGIALGLSVVGTGCNNLAVASKRELGISLSVKLRPFNSELCATIGNVTSCGSFFPSQDGEGSSSQGSSSDNSYISGGGKACHITVISIATFEIVAILCHILTILMQFARFKQVYSPSNCLMCSATSFFVIDAVLASIIAVAGYFVPRFVCDLNPQSLSWNNGLTIPWWVASAGISWCACVLAISRTCCCPPMAVNDQYAYMQTEMSVPMVAPMAVQVGRVVDYQ